MDRICPKLAPTANSVFNCLERSRQLNTLFAVGASFGQIRSMIFWEAAFLVVTGELVGIVCGFMLSYLLIYVINRQSFGWTFLYGVDWSALIMNQWISNSD